MLSKGTTIFLLLGPASLASASRRRFRFELDGVTARALSRRASVVFETIGSLAVLELDFDGGITATTSPRRVGVDSEAIRPLVVLELDGAVTATTSPRRVSVDSEAVRPLVVLELDGVVTARSPRRVSTDSWAFGWVLTDLDGKVEEIAEPRPVRAEFRVVGPVELVLDTAVEAIRRGGMTRPFNGELDGEVLEVRLSPRRGRLEAVFRTGEE